MIVWDAVFMLIAAAAVSLALHRAVTTDRRFPPLPWVGRQKGPFSLARAALASVTRSSDWLAEGYNKVINAPHCEHTFADTTSSSERMDYHI